MPSKCVDKYVGLINTTQKAGADDKLYVERTAKGGESAVFDLKPNESARTNVTKHDAFNYDDTEALISVNPSQEQSPRAKQCTSGGGGGKLAGVGPSCSLPEIGHGEFHQCLFRKATDCWGAFQRCVLEVGDQVNRGNVFSTGAPAGHLPFAHANPKANCEARKKDCLSQAKQTCSCSDCVYTSCYSDCGDDSDPGTDPTIDPTDPLNPTDPITDHRTIPGVTSATFTRSQYYVKRPIAHGRYILAGNIFWMGAISVDTVELTTTENRGDAIATVKTTLSVPRTSFAVGLCEGPMDAVLRVWIGDTLLFNNTVPTNEDGSVQTPPEGKVIDEIENSVFFTNNTNDPVFYDTSKIKITFFSGREDQVPPAAMGANAPGYRGMAYLLIENFNLAYVNGRLPEIHVEVVRKTTEEFPFQHATLDNSLFTAFDPYAWIVDKTADVLYAPHADGFRRVAFSTLKEIDVTANADQTGYPTNIAPSTFTLFGDGSLFFQAQSANNGTVTYLVDPNSKVVKASAGAESTTTPSAAYVLQPSNYFLNTARSGASLNIGFHGYKAKYFSGAQGQQVVTTDYAIMVRPDGYAMGADLDNTLNPYKISVRGPDVSSFDACVETCIDSSYIDCLVANGCDLEGDGTSPCETGCYDSVRLDCETTCAGANIFYDTFASQITAIDYPQTLTGIDEPRTQTETSLFLFNLEQGSTQAGLNIKKYRIHDTGRTPVYNAFDVVNNFQLLVDGTIPASAWGGETYGITGQYVIYDAARKAFVAILRANGADAIILSIKADGLTVNWATRLPQVPNAGMMASAPASDYWFVTDDGGAHRLDLSSGEVTFEYNLGDIGAPAKSDGTQYFDPFTASITYVSSGTFHKVYVNRYAAAAASVGDIVRDYCAKAGIDPIYVDTTGIDDLTVDGYLLDEGIAPRDAMDNLTKLFGLTACENGQGLFFRKAQDTTPVMELTVDDYNENGFVYTREDPFNQVVSLRLTYADINKQCRATHQTVKQGILRAGSLDDVTYSTYQTPAVFVNDQDAVDTAERLFSMQRLPVVKGTFGGGLSLSALEPGDLITINGIKTRIKTTSSANGQIAIETQEDFSFVNDFLSVTIPRNASTSVQTNYDAYKAMRARVFYLPPLSTADAVLAGTTDFVLYFGLEPMNAGGDFVATNIGYQFTGFDDNWRDGPKLTEALILGRSLNTDFNQATSDGTPDAETTLEVLFDRPFSLTSMISTIDEIAQNSEKNLIVVGREVLQWASCTVDSGDPRLVTFTGLLRGRWGTASYIHNHKTGEPVIFVTPESLKSASAPLEAAMFGGAVAVRTWAWSNVSQRQRIDSYAFDYEPMRYPAPVHIHKYHASNGDIKLTWHGTTIYGNYLDDGLPLNPISPDLETYNDFSFNYGKNQGDVNAYGELYAVYIYGNFVYGAYKQGTETETETIQRLIDNRWLYNSFVFSKEFLVTGSNEVYIKKSILDTYGLGQANDMNVAIVRLGGGNMKVPGRVSLASFKRGVYPAIPPVRSLRISKLSRLYALSPGRLVVPKFNRFIVVRPRT